MTGADSIMSRALPVASSAMTSTMTTSARSASAMRCAVVAPTLPAPTTVTLWSMAVSRKREVRGKRLFGERPRRPVRARATLRKAITAGPRARLPGDGLGASDRRRPRGPRARLRPLQRVPGGRRGAHRRRHPLRRRQRRERAPVARRLRRAGGARHRGGGRAPRLHRRRRGHRVLAPGPSLRPLPANAWRSSRATCRCSAPTPMASGWRPRSARCSPTPSGSATPGGATKNLGASGTGESS